MKFLCDQCKAKYQIADEKVQGKTLRMKCRKCGHVIEIRAATEAAATGATVQLSALSEDDAAAVIARASAPPPAAPPKPSAPFGARAPLGARAPMKPATMPPRAAPLKTPAPRPATGFGPNAPKTAPGKDPKPPSGVLASAFNKQVTSSTPTIVDTPPPAAQQGADVPTEEWYVAIDDVPVGPIRLSELRSKYAQGAARDESLVWREGYEEWRPLQSLPDLFRVVKEEVSGAQAQPRGASLLPSSPRQSSTRTSAPSVSRPSPRPAAASPGPAARGGNVIPFVQPRGGAAAARKLEDDFDEEPTQIAASPFAAPKPEPAPVSATSAKVVADPFAAPIAAAPIAPAAPVASSSHASSHVDDPGRPTMMGKLEARGISKGAVALIAAGCLLFGVVIAVFAIKPKVVEKVVEKRVDVPVSVTVPTGSTETAPTTTEAAPTATAPTAKVAAKGGGGGASAPTTTTTSTATSKKLGSSDMGPEGPAVGGTGPGTAAGAGGSLDGKSVEGVVASKRVGVRKVCYEPWADKGGASVKVTLKIGSDGRVQSSDIASSSGEPAIGQCVQRLAKTWSFPQSEAGGTFNIPFLFGT